MEIGLPLADHVNKSTCNSSLGAKVPGSESSMSLLLRGTKVPRNESSRERKYQGAKVPANESSTYGTFAPGSESTWERKFRNSLRCPPPFWPDRENFLQATLYQKVRFCCHSPAIIAQFNNVWWSSFIISIRYATKIRPAMTSSSNVARSFAMAFLTMAVTIAITNEPRCWIHYWLKTTYSISVVCTPVWIKVNKG